MEVTKMNAAARTGTGKGPNRRLRAQGMVPGILYGKGADSVQIAIKPTDVVTVLESPLGRNSVLGIEVEGGGSFKALIRDFQLEPVRRTLLHVDFILVQEGVPVVVDVPVSLTGMGDFEKLGGQRRMTGRTIKVSCLPVHIPTTISIDVAHIDKPEVIYASGVELGDNIEAAYRHDFPVVVFAMGRSADEEVVEGAEEEGEAAGEDDAAASEDGE